MDQMRVAIKCFNCNGCQYLKSVSQRLDHLSISIVINNHACWKYISEVLVGY